MRMRTAVLALVALLLLTGSAMAQAVTVLYGGRTIEVAQTLPDPTDLWVTAKDLTRINGFVVKAAEVCLDALCVPVPANTDSTLKVTRSGAQWFNVAALARSLDQPFSANQEKGVWSFGQIPAKRVDNAAAGMAPDFELPDRQGRMVRLSDYRGKKVLLLTWASWCGCRMDLVNWESVYQDLKGENFEIIAVAEDTAGESVAGPWYDRAKATYPTLLDTQHAVTSLYNLVNVPSGVWINERGQIDRITDGAYARRIQLGNMEFGATTYVPAMTDWIRNGAKSRFTWTPEERAKKVRALGDKEALADATFRLGAYFQSKGDTALAQQYWKEAQELDPDNWNFFRQAWSYNADMGQRIQQRQQERGARFYQPLDLPGVADEVQVELPGPSSPAAK